MKPSEVLRKAADLIEPEGAWAQGYFSREATGARCHAISPKASCWCARGATWAAAGSATDCEAADEFVVRALYLAHDGQIAVWNDNPERTQPEVVAALRKAAELAESEGQ